jgi:hypothetical protein
MLLAAIRRFALVAALSVTVTAIGSLAFGALIGASLHRSLVLGFYLVGCFLLVSGFFVGNRGPARVKAEGPGPSFLPIPGIGDRQLRWATLSEQNETINNSAIFVCLGLILVAVAVIFDNRQSLI